MNRVISGFLMACFCALTACSLKPRSSVKLLARSARIEESYAGDQTCKTCHLPAFEGHYENHDRRTLAALDPRHHGCESCHGPALEHARSGGALHPTLRAGRAEQNQNCLACHAAETRHSQWHRTAHGRAQLACSDCHTSSAARFPAQRESIENQCQKCHQDVALQFALPNRHPVPEGIVRCIDCHDPHAPNLMRARRDAQERKCLECHSDKKGPFAFPHMADRSQGCTACHSPHGSTNRRLLQQTRIQNLCLSCHADTPTSHDLSTPRYQNCVACHTEIHGSHWDRLFLR